MTTLSFADDDGVARQLSPAAQRLLASIGESIRRAILPQVEQLAKAVGPALAVPFAPAVQQMREIQESLSPVFARIARDNAELFEELHRGILASAALRQAAEARRSEIVRAVAARRSEQRERAQANLEDYRQSLKSRPDVLRAVSIALDEAVLPPNASDDEIQLVSLARENSEAIEVLTSDILASSELREPIEALVEDLPTCDPKRAAQHMWYMILGGSFGAALSAPIAVALDDKIHAPLDMAFTALSFCVAVLAFMMSSQSKK
ncbi:hypothetical protein SMD20_39830 [Nonomuraea sp. LP-02]|uniref:hypothetical protein n=1 Tax=Nonomuraea sp. LP-02 TaxID=3097960 RepID=UPI002E34BC32|nr:hypothetical protein [Nonomuraea sp. LP-02]MED7930430.1 hypothetical protein [Nonomuraea sp. LP-02]